MPPSHIAHPTSITLAALLTLAACTPRPALPPLQPYAGDTKRMLVIASMGTYLLPKYTSSFEAALPTALAACAVQAKVIDAQGKLDYGDPPEAAQAEAAFQPDTILRIDDLDRPYQAPSPNIVTYQLTLSDAHTGQPVWRQQEELQLIGAWFGLVDLGQAFANRVTALMTRRGAIRSCPSH